MVTTNRDAGLAGAFLMNPDFASKGKIFSQLFTSCGVIARSLTGILSRSSTFADDREHRDGMPLCFRGDGVHGGRILDVLVPDLLGRGNQVLGEPEALLMNEVRAM